MSNAIIMYLTKENERGLMRHYNYSVDVEWLANLINGHDKLADFLSEYTSDESIGIYNKALIDGAVVKDLSLVI